VQANVATLKARGVNVIEPGSGYLACGMVGGGRMAEPAAIVAAIAEVLAEGSEAGLGQGRDFTGETVLVTAGGTREAIDPVRFIGNRSSGRMGYAVAEAARRRGAKVVLISAPTGLPCPAGVEVEQVVTVEDMRADASRGDGSAE
jgi:phosphopantothenoylcysteine decarboxylase / phosphopantothenate---cysteine ligase